MKRIIILLLIITVFIASCAKKPGTEAPVTSDEKVITVSTDVPPVTTESVTNVTDAPFTTFEKTDKPLTTEEVDPPVIVPTFFDPETGIIYRYESSDTKFYFDFYRRNAEEVYFRVFSSDPEFGTEFASIYDSDFSVSDDRMKLYYEDEFMNITVLCSGEDAEVKSDFFYDDESEIINGNYSISSIPGQEEVEVPSFPEYQPDPNTDGFEMDKTLAEAIRESLGYSPDALLTVPIVSSIRVLNIEADGIVSLKGLERLTSLEQFYAENTFVSDLSPIIGLSSLKDFQLGRSFVSEIPDLSGLAKLEILGLVYCNIRDVSNIATAENLKYLFLANNYFNYIEPLKSLKHLEMLDVRNNCILDFEAVKDSKTIRDALKKSDLDLDLAILTVNRAKEIVDSVTTGEMTDLEKEYKLHEYIVRHTKYEVVYGLPNPDGYDVLVDGHGVCLSYANAFCLLGNVAGINTIVINSDTHSWNMVEIDGKWYHVDTLWDDTVDNDGDELSFYYFNRGTALINNTMDHGHDLLRYPAACDMDKLFYGYLINN